MEYYLMNQMEVNPVKYVLLKPEMYAYLLTKENFEKIPELSIGYYEYGVDVTLPDVMVRPTFMVNETIKNVIEMYDETVTFKTLTFLPNAMDEMKEKSKSYAIPNVRRFDCLHEESVIMPEGTIKKLIIDRKKIPNADIFQIKNTIQNKVVVSLRMAESISRRNVYGVEFQKVQVK